MSIRRSGEGPMAEHQQVGRKSCASGGPVTGPWLRIMSYSALEEKHRERGEVRCGARG